MNPNRKPIVAGNWKMNTTVAEAAALAAAVKRLTADCKGVDIVLCPPFTALAAVGNQIAGSPIGLGAQTMHWEKAGAFTGEISAAMLRDLYCHYVILGHSERRALFGESDEAVHRKVLAALAGNLHPIVCVGETLAQRQAGETDAVVGAQIRRGLAGLGPEQWAGLVIAYEPVWAIGTGVTATPDQAQAVHRFIREQLRALAGDRVAQSARIQYGGSVKASNAADLFRQADIDGGLIGGAALEAESFAAIVKAAVQA